jgi:valine--pyruvate aminotransferase
MEFSKFGEKFTGHSGILQLMDDLGNAVAGDKDAIMLGGGNPSHIPSVQRLFRQRMIDILENGDEFEHLVGDYDPPGGALEQALWLADHGQEYRPDQR